MTRAREIANVLGRNIESTTFTATAGQTAFSITHAAGRIQVYMNGLLLDPTVDWTSDGSTVTLTEGAVAGDELEVVKFDNLAVADAIPRTGHTGTIDFSDATFVPPAGHIVQVVSKQLQSYAAASGTNASNLADLGLKVSITPKFSTSHFFITVNVGVASTTSGNSYGGVLTRNNTVIGGGNTWSGSSFSGLLFRGPDHTGNSGTDVNHGAGASGSYLDTTTGTAGTAIEYNCKFVGESGSVHINHVESLYNGGGFPVAEYTASTITVMEIAQ